MMTWSALGGSILATWLVVCLAACVPDLPSPLQNSATEVGGEPWLELTPDTPEDEALPVLRLRLHLPATAPEDVDRSQVVFVQGRVGKAHLRQIAEGEMSNALLERVIPSLSWVEAGERGGAEVVVAPTVVLAPGETYALALGTPQSAHHIQVAAEGAPPVLPRVWPPLGGSATVAMGVWCGDPALPDDAAAAELAPGGPPGTLRRGAVDGVGARCLRFEASTEGAGGEPAGPFVGPPALVAGAAATEPGATLIVSLDPRPFVVEAEAPSQAAISCEPEEAPFGPGCAVTADDRLYVRSGDAPVLWAIRGEGLDLVVAAAAGDPLLIAPLPPLTPIALDVTTIDAAGRAEQGSFSAVTLAPRPHVVITEVLANPLGPEPNEEWVELYNDGSVPAELGGYVLCDIGGETALPAGGLAPAAYALIVNEDYVEDDELDPPPAPGTLILRVPKLGKNGLANSGETLKLKDKTGAVVSRTPAVAYGEPGMSLARVSARAPDGLANSFAPSWPTPGRENILVEQGTP